MVMIEVAGFGTKKVGIANLPPGTPDETIHSALSPYGDVKKIAEDQWSRIYRYQVSNGVRLAEVVLRKHIPSHKIILGIRVLITYEGQPVTCYGYNAPGHQYRSAPTGDKQLLQDQGRRDERRRL